MPEKIKPLRDHVLVKIVKQNKRTQSGIVLPESAHEEKPQTGEVVAVGESSEIKVKKGQLVIFAKYSGTEIKIKNEDYLILKNEDLLGIIQ